MHEPVPQCGRVLRIEKAAGAPVFSIPARSAWTGALGNTPAIPAGGHLGLCPPAWSGASVLTRHPDQGEQRVSPRVAQGGAHSLRACGVRQPTYRPMEAIHSPGRRQDRGQADGEDVHGAEAARGAARHGRRSTRHAEERALPGAGSPSLQRRLQARPRGIVAKRIADPSCSKAKWWKIPKPDLLAEGGKGRAARTSVTSRGRGTLSAASF